MRDTSRPRSRARLSFVSTCSNHAAAGRGGFGFAPQNVPPEFRSGLGKETQQREPYQERIRGGARPPPERGRKSRLLRFGQSFKVPEHGVDQLMDRRVRELGLRLHGDDRGHPAAHGAAHQMVQQGRLPYPRLAPQHQRATGTRANVRHQRVQDGALQLASQERGSWPADAGLLLLEPDGETIRFEDALQGPQSFVCGVDFGDFVIWRQDGVPAYQRAHAARPPARINPESLITSVTERCIASSRGRE